ncbi:MAG: hypothetical protein WD673_14220 [Alphaproteobacteria bacterium]
MGEFLPDGVTSLLIVALSIARFENQRWMRARMRGLRGANVLVGELVDWTCILATVLMFAFLIAYGYEVGIGRAVTLLLISVLSMVVYSIASTLILGGDNFVAWLIGTLAVWPIVASLIPRVNWFGYL